METLAERMIDDMPGEAHILNVLARYLEEAVSDLDQYHLRLTMKVREQAHRTEGLRMVRPEA